MPPRTGSPANIQIASAFHLHASKNINGGLDKKDAAYLLSEGTEK